MTAHRHVVLPIAGRSDLKRRLDHQIEVNAILLATTRPPTRTPRTPLLSPAELAELDAAYTRGLTPEAFARTLIARDKAGAS